MTPAARSSLVVLLVAACGSTGDRPPADVVRAVPQVSYDEDPAGREVVARVDDVPIYADCVARQMSVDPARGSSASALQAALDDCVAFELLAQEARRRGLTSDPDAVMTQRREAVRALIDRVFTPLFDSPDDVPRADIERFWPRLQRYFNHTELRSALHCRFKLKRGTVRNGPEDLEAKRLAGELYPKVAGRKVDLAELIQLCGEATATHAMLVPEKPFTFEHGGNVDRAYADAVFAVPAAGRVTPPVRTAWGWDLILVTEIAPAVNKSFAEAVPELQQMFFYDPDFEGYRENHFLLWAARFGKGVAVEVHPERIPASEDIQAEALGAVAADPALPAPSPAPTRDPVGDGDTSPVTGVGGDDREAP
jgi:hypothetical protein